LFEVDIAVKELETSHFLALMVAANLDVGERRICFYILKVFLKILKKLYIFFKLIHF
jgi:hypothetical protein